jgi:putative transposase
MPREKAIAAETRSSYGSRRMAKQLQDEGLPVGRHKVRRLMRQAAVTVARLKKRQPVSIDSWQASQVAPNLLARQFDVAQPDTVWVGDMTYVWTAEGWEYLAVWAVAFLSGICQPQ